MNSFAAQGPATRETALTLDMPTKMTKSLLLWNSVLVVAGPIDEVEGFRAAAAGRRLRVIRPDEDESGSSYWMERAELSRASLLGLLDPGTRAKLARRLPRLRSVLLRAPTETEDGRRRLEYWLDTEAGTSALVLVCRALTQADPTLRFVIATANARCTVVEATLLHCGCEERYRLPEARRSAHLRRERRRWGRSEVGDDMVLQDAADAMLNEVAGHWDAGLAQDPCPVCEARP